MTECDELLFADPKRELTFTVVFKASMGGMPVLYFIGKIVADDVGLVVDGGEGVDGWEDICSEDCDVFVLGVGEGVGAIFVGVYL